MIRGTCAARFVVAALFVVSTAPWASAQEARGSAPPPPQGRGGGRGAQAPAVVSPEVLPDRHLTFRIYAPQAQAVRLAAGDIPGVGQTTAADQGRERRLGGDARARSIPAPIATTSTSTASRPSIRATPRPASPTTTSGASSCVPGSDFMDTKNVPHGAVAAVTYYSTALNAFRRMHVYTPPGYETGTRQVSGVLPAARRRRQRRRVDDASAAPASSSTT